MSNRADGRSKYIVRDGRRHGAYNEYGPGDEVWLTAEEAASIMDKVRKASSGESGATIEGKRQEVLAALPERPADALSKIADAYDIAGDENEVDATVALMEDSELREVSGIGKKAVESIRAYLAAKEAAGLDEIED